MNNYKDSISKYIFVFATALLSFIFYNIFISTFLFIFKVSIQPWYSIASLLLMIITITVVYICIEKNKKRCLFKIITTSLLAFLVILVSTYLNSQIYDTTWDGNSYHKSTIGLMADGWNPLYEDMQEYDSKQENPIDVQSNSYNWGNHYAKASHIFAANILSTTGNIESGKVLNTLSIIILFSYTIAILLYAKKSYLFSIIFSVVVVTYPVVCAQYLTNYVDLLVYIYLILTILMFFAFEKPIINQKLNLFIFFMLLNIVINIKFSAFGYAGIFCLGYYIWYIYRVIKKKIELKFFRNFTIISVLSVISAIFIIGLSVYPKNFLEHGNPFYPIMGEGKIEIMLQNQPAYFENKTPIEKFIISTFSRAENISQSSGLEATYKIPFTVDDTELESLSNVDLRISGNGVLFSGILIISLVILLLTSIFVFKNNRKLFLMIIIPIIITFIMIFALNESWWARYFPQLYFIVLGSILFLESFNKKAIKIVMFIFMALIIVNNSLTFYYSTKYAYDESKLYASQFNDFELENSAETCQMELYTHAFHGTIYNVLERYSDYNIYIINEQEYNDIGPEKFKTFMNSFLVWKCKE